MFHKWLMVFIAVIPFSIKGMELTVPTDIECVNSIKIIRQQYSRRFLQTCHHLPEIPAKRALTLRLVKDMTKEIDPLLTCLVAAQRWDLIIPLFQPKTIFLFSTISSGQERMLMRILAADMLEEVFPLTDEIYHAELLKNKIHSRKTDCCQYSTVEHVFKSMNFSDGQEI